MFKDRDKMYQAYHTILCMALAWAAAIGINEYFSLGVHVAISALFVMLLAVLIYLFDINRRNPLSYIIIISSIPVIGLVFWIRGVNPFDKIAAMLRWAQRYDRTQEMYHALHAHILVFGISIAAVALFYLLLKHKYAKSALAVGLFVMLILLTLWKVNPHKIVVGVCIFYILSNLVEYIGGLYNRITGRPEKRDEILYLAPICLLLAVISVGMPSKPEPIQWKGVIKLYNSIKGQIEIWVDDWEFFRGKGPSEFTLAMTGYSEDGGKLSNAELLSSDRVAMRVKGSIGEAGVYFIGSISDTYTGNSWDRNLNINNSETEEYLLDYYELLYALSRADKELLAETRLVQRRSLEVEYDTIRTKTLFYPLKSSETDVRSRSKEPNASLSSITFPKVRGNGTSYSTIYYELNLENEKLQQIFREAEKFSYKDGAFDSERIKRLEREVFNFSRAPIAEVKPNLYADLTARAEQIKEIYTQLPEELPERVIKLAEDITKDSDTAYDKLKVIESYLNTYSYNVNPGGLPKGRDFVDYFLFDNKQGYCTSFASALAVLGRCVGIPTRYVEGFVMDSSDKQEDYYLIRNYKAHAWAEAYLEGVGWIPFEATPSFYDLRYVQWKEFKRTEDKTDYSYLFNKEPDIIIPFLPEGELLTSDAKQTKLSGMAIAGIVTAFTLITVLIFLLIYYMILRLKFKKTFEKADYDRKMYMLFLRILNLLKKEGFTLSTEETIQMLADRIRDTFVFKSITFQVVSEVFMRYRYGDTEPSMEEFIKTECFYEGLMNMRKEKYGKIRLHIEEFLYLAGRKKGQY